MWVWIFSYREWVRDTKNTLQPQFSDGFRGKDGKYRIALTYPVTIKNNSGTNNFAGIVCAVAPTKELFSF